MSKQNKITAQQYAERIGLNNRSKFYVKKVLSKSSLLTSNQWKDKFTQLKLIDKKQ